MIKTRFPLLVSSLFILLASISCKKAESTKSTDNEATNGPALVKAAYAKVDPMKVEVTFTRERIPFFKARWEKETDIGKKLNYQFEYAFELLKVGDAAGAVDQYVSGIKFINENHIPIDTMNQRNLLTILGIAYMRMGELQNCVANHNHQSCFIPIAGEGVHTLKTGSENAIIEFESSLRIYPDDPETKYLLNIAYQTLGKYPEGVPAQWRIPPSWFTNKVKIQPFQDVAPQLGLNRNGRAGGVVMDDFTNDGWLDVVISSWTHDDPVLFYKNNGDGTFTEMTKQSGLEGQTGSLCMNQTDFNNDGWLDLYIMRGAWLRTEGRIPNTLLMNKGDGTFEDVTVKAGLNRYFPTQAAAWADFNLDGWVDLIVANETSNEIIAGIDFYINNHNGTFSYQSNEWGLTHNAFFKGVVAVDANNDRWPDIYLSSLSTGNLLAINHGYEGKFQFIPSPTAETTAAPEKSFPCWNFDFDNDGMEDIFVSAYANDKSPAVMWMSSHQNQPDKAFLPKLYHNKGNLQFEEVGIPMGLTEVAYTMGCNFGDINTDGYLDFYLATGNPLFQSIVPNKMYLNMDGRKFEDVSYSGFANIQKGHEVSFGDWNHDGDEDMYAVIGGAYDGDMFYNCLFDNPNEKNNNWVVLKLEGTTCNKAAIGARVMISVEENGKERKIARTVTSGASFGANSLQLEVGLRKATKVNSVTVNWPCLNCPDQTFTGVGINKAYKLIQDNNTPQEISYKAVQAPAMDMQHHM